MLLDIEPRIVACGPVGPHVTQDLEHAISFFIFLSWNNILTIKKGRH